VTEVVAPGPGPGHGTIVVATDGSAGAHRALDWAIDHARERGVDLVAVRVVEPVADPGPTLAEVEAELVAAVRARYERATAVVRAAADVAEAVIAAAVEARAQVLVVGNAGMRGRTEFLLGNVANRITHGARCTVVVVNSSGEAEAGPAPSEGGDGLAPDLARRAAEIARELGRPLLRQLGGRSLGGWAAGGRGSAGGGADAGARDLRLALERLGPTFGKLGQILSTRPDLVPPAYVRELSQLQSSVPPMGEAEVVGAMEASLGVPWEDVFASIDPDPLAAGTIGQVHRATLADGSRVVVKVQRAGAARLVEQDLALLEGLARRAAGSRRVAELVDLPSVVEQLGTALRQELDFCHEADNLERMAAALAPYPHLAVPRPHRELSSARLLVMDEIVGAVPVSEAPPGEARTAAARELLQSYYRQILEDGFFHADPHPGNLLWADDRIWLLDLGMVGSLDRATRRHLVLLLLAFAQGDVSLLADVSLDLGGEVPADLDVAAFERDLQEVLDAVAGRPLGELQLADLLNRLTAISVRHRVPLPASLAMVGKALGQVQLTVAEIEPDIDPIAEAGRFLGASVLRRVAGRADPQDLLYQAEKARYRLTQVADGLAAVAGNRPGRQLEVRFTSARLERSVQRAGRTVALGLSAGLACVAATIAAGSERIDPRAARVVNGLAAGLSMGLAADLLRGRSPSSG
jgi:predicted unusual protein kinase regulating ubiquinone biosynthesis (AarF/ABC1/UbiB family)/nucleotide-binding universal stress UspA family protein